MKLLPILLGQFFSCICITIFRLSSQDESKDRKMNNDERNLPLVVDDSSLLDDDDDDQGEEAYTGNEDNCNEHDD